MCVVSCDTPPLFKTVHSVASKCMHGAKQTGSVRMVRRERSLAMAHRRVPVLVPAITVVVVVVIVSVACVCDGQPSPSGDQYLLNHSRFNSRIGVTDSFGGFHV